MPLADLQDQADTITAMPALPLLAHQLLCFQQFLSAANKQADPFSLVHLIEDFEEVAEWEKATIEIHSERSTRHIGLLVVLPLTKSQEGYCNVDAWMRTEGEYTVRFSSSTQPDFVMCTYREGAIWEAMSEFCRSVAEDARMV